MHQTRIRFDFKLVFLVLSVIAAKPACDGRARCKSLVPGNWRPERLFRVRFVFARERGPIRFHRIGHNLCARNLLHLQLRDLRPVRDGQLRAIYHQYESCRRQNLSTRGDWPEDHRSDHQPGNDERAFTNSTAHVLDCHIHHESHGGAEHVHDATRGCATKNIQYHVCDLHHVDVGCPHPPPPSCCGRFSLRRRSVATSPPARPRRPHRPTDASRVRGAVCPGS